MLKPRDLIETDFKKVWKGYDPKEVDHFVQRVVTEYESLYQENQDLSERVRELEGRLESSADKEQQIGDALRMAREAAKEARATAESEANMLIRRAELRAEELRLEAGEQVRAEIDRVKRVQREEVRFRTRLQALLTSYLELLESSEDEAERFAESVGSLSQAAATVDEPVQGGAPSEAASDAASSEATQRYTRAEKSDPS